MLNVVFGGLQTSRRFLFVLCTLGLPSCVAATDTEGLAVQASNQQPESVCRRHYAVTAIINDWLSQGASADAQQLTQLLQQVGQQVQDPGLSFGETVPATAMPPLDQRPSHFRIASRVTDELSMTLEYQLMASQDNRPSAWLNRAFVWGTAGQNMECDLCDTDAQREMPDEVGHVPSQKLVTVPVGDQQRLHFEVYGYFSADDAVDVYDLPVYDDLSNGWSNPKIHVEVYAGATGYDYQDSYVSSFCEDEDRLDTVRCGFLTQRSNQCFASRAGSISATLDCTNNKDDGTMRLVVRRMTTQADCSRYRFSLDTN